MSMLINKESKMCIDDILNATLAGGVIIGAASGVLTNLGGAIAIGFIGGSVSTIGFAILDQKIQKAFGVHDTCGVHNLHGMPGVLGGLVSAIIIAAYQAQPMD